MKYIYITAVFILQLKIGKWLRNDLDKIKTQSITSDLFPGQSEGQKTPFLE